MAQVNHHNFLRFDDTTGNLDLNHLSHGYWLDRERCDTAIVAVPGETMSFYLNSEDGIALGTFANLRLALVNSVTGAIAAASAGTLQQHVIDGTKYNVYSTFVFPSVAKGLYHFRIRDTVLNVVKLISNNFEVVTSGYEHNTTYCRFRHDRYFYGTPYGSLPTFYQQFRLNITEIEDGPENEREVYKEITTGKRITYKTSMDWTHKMETYYFGYLDHFAAAVMVEHDFFEMNGEMYVLKDTYSKAANARQKLVKGNFTCYGERFASFNRCAS